MALSADKNTPRRDGELYSYPCAAAKQFYKGQIVFLDSSGNAEPATAATGKICAGVSQMNQLSTTAALAAEFLDVRTGIFHFANSVADAVAKDDIGSVVYAEDDQTIMKTLGTNSPVGYMVDIDSDGVWVQMHSPNNANPSGALLVANNLSDATAATARANIAANLMAFTVLVDDLVGANTQKRSFVSPIAGDIVELKCVLMDHALATGNATITGDIGGTPITTGVITITQAGSAVDDVDKCTPSAANTVAEDDVVSFTVGGTNDDTDAKAYLTVYIEY